jgi:hypothetical protein
MRAVYFKKAITDKLDKLIEQGAQSGREVDYFLVTKEEYKELEGVTTRNVAGRMLYRGYLIVAE